jgi:DNA-binding transcriptional regulator YiaG
LTKDETKNVLFVIRASYPEAYRGLTENDLEILLATWNTLLADYSYSDVSLAVQHYLTNDTYGRAPKIGQIIDSLRKTSVKPELNANEAWGLVYKAICNSTYNSEQEFEKLPQTVQKAVGSANNLKEYASMNIEDVQVTIKAHFKSIYEVEVKRKQEYEKLPQATRTLIEEQEHKRIREEARQSKIEFLTRLGLPTDCVDKWD